MHLPRNVLIPYSFIILVEQFNVSVIKLLLFLYLLHFSFDLDERAWLSSAFGGEDELKKFFLDSCPVKIGIAYDVGPSNMHFSFFTSSFLQKYLKSSQIFENNVTNKLKFLIVVHLLEFILFGSKCSENILYLKGFKHIEINL